MRSTLTKLLLVLLVGSIPLNAFSAPTCNKLFDTRNLLQKSSSLFIKNANPNPLPTKLLGFATAIPAAPQNRSLFSKSVYYTFDFIPNKLGHLITLNRSYTFTPFKAIDELVFDKPAHFASQKLLGKKKELGILIKLPLMIALTVSAWTTFDQKVFLPAAEQKAAEQLLDYTQKNSTYFDNLIENDFRFQNIKSIKETSTAKQVTYNGKNIQEYIETPQVKARFLAFGLKRSYEDYFSTYSQIKNPRALTLEENLALFGSNELFSNLNFFFENGVRQFEGTYVAPQHQGPLSDLQKKHLFDLNHLLYAKYITIDVMFDAKRDINALIAKNAIARDIYNDPYTQKLLKLHSQGQITKSQLIYFIQEDAQHNYYMSLFDSLHITNLKSENGAYTNEAITLGDLRDSRLQSIKESVQ